MYKIYKIQCRELAAFFLVSFCTYFMTAIMSFSPIYITTMLGCFFIFTLKHWANITFTTKVTYFSHILFSVWYIFCSLIVNSPLHSAIVSCFFGLYYIFVDFSLCQIRDKKTLIKILYSYFVLFAIYYIIDFLFRYQNMKNSTVPDWIKVNPIYMFYMLKEGGIYGDSNAIGMFTLLLSSVIFLAYNKRLISKKILICSIIMLILSFSRAAMVSFFALFIFYHLFLQRNAYFKFFAIYLVIALAIFAFMFFLSDPSFKTKIVIFQETMDYLKECTMFQLLFGNGPNSSIQVLGDYGHNIWSILIPEYGLIQTFLFITVIFLTTIDTGKKSFYVLIPYFLCSLSFTPVMLQFLFTAFALIKCSNRILKEDNNEKKR